MSDNEIVKLPILEPLASYFGTLYKFKPGGNPGDVKINFSSDNPEQNDIFWKMYANTQCYSADSNNDAKNGDIAHQFTQAVVALANNLKEIDPSTTSGTIQEYLVNKIEPSIKKVFPNGIKENKLVEIYFEKKSGRLRNELLLKKKYYDEIIKEILDDFNEIIQINKDNNKSCNKFKQILLNSISEPFDDRNNYVTLNGEKDADIYELNQCNAYFNEYLPDSLIKLIKEAGDQCFRREYKLINQINGKDKQKIINTIELIKENNNANILFNKYFEFKDKDNNKIDNYKNLDLDNTRINLKKNNTGEIKLFRDLPLRSKDGEIFTSNKQSIHSTELFDIADTYYNDNTNTNFGYELIDAKNDSLDYTEAVCTNIKPKNNTVFNVSAIKNLLQKWLNKEKSTPSYMYSTPSSYRVLSTKEDLKKFEDELVNEEEEMKKIIRDLPENKWVKRGSVYFKRDTSGKETLYELNNNAQFVETCASVGYSNDDTNCIRVLTDAVSGDLEKLKELLKDDTFVKALNDPKLVQNLPPQIALKLLKTFGFKKTAIPSVKGTMFIIEPIAGWLNRLSKTTNGKNLISTINSNKNFMTLIRFLIGIVHQNPTIIGNNPRVVIPKQPITPTNIVTQPQPVTWRTWPSIPVKTIETTKEHVLTIEEIKKNLKPLNFFYKGLNLSNTPFGLSNFNPVLTKFLSYIPYNGNGLIRGGGNSRIVAKVQFGLGLNYADEFIRVYNIIKEKLKNNLPIEIGNKINSQLTTFKYQEITLLEELSKLQKLSTLKELGLLEGIVNNENDIQNNLKDYQQKIDDYMKNRKKTDNTLKTLMSMYKNILPSNLYNISI